LLGLADHGVFFELSGFALAQHDLLTTPGELAYGHGFPRIATGYFMEVIAGKELVIEVTS
jgi:hypothetical protein